MGGGDDGASMVLGDDSMALPGGSSVDLTGNVLALKDIEIGKPSMMLIKDSQELNGGLAAIHLKNTHEVNYKVTWEINGGENGHAESEGSNFIP